MHRSLFARALAVLSVCMTLLGLTAATSLSGARGAYAADAVPSRRAQSVPADDPAIQVVPTARPGLPSVSAEEAKRAQARALRERLARRFAWPIAGRITSDFGSRRSPVTDELEFHGGIDIGCDTGEAIRASRAGVVLVGGRIKVLGRAVVIQHPDGWTTVYGHMDSLSVYGGLTVERGQVIGTCGQTGRATGPHVHFEIRGPGARAIDPLLRLPAQARAARS